MHLEKNYKCLYAFRKKIINVYILQSRGQTNGHAVNVPEPDSTEPAKTESSPKQSSKKQTTPKPAKKEQPQKTEPAKKVKYFTFNFFKKSFPTSEDLFRRVNLVRTNIYFFVIEYRKE